MVGSGVFITTGIVYGTLENPWLVLLVWVLGALFSMAGAVTFAKLAVLFPYAGGEYVYLKKAYSPLIAFLNGWAALLITFSASISVLGLTFGEYLAFLLPYDSQHVFFRWELGGVVVKLGYPGLVGLIAIFVFTIVNYFGIKKASLIQNGIFFIQVFGFFIFSIFALFKFNDRIVDWIPSLPNWKGIQENFSPIILACIPVVFSYLGWNMVTYIAEEIKEPEKNISRTIFLGTGLVAILYILVNLGFLVSLEPEILKLNDGLGVRASVSVFGNSASLFFSLFFCIVILGSLSASIIGGSRIYFAMARDGLFFPFLSKVHVHYHSPYNSLFFQAIYASLFILFELEFLLYTITSAILLLSALTAFSVFIFEKRGYQSSYRIPFYPITPMVYIICCFLLVIHLSIENPSRAFFGVLILMTGIPIYFIFRNKFRRLENEKSKEKAQSLYRRY